MNDAIEGEYVERAALAVREPSSLAAAPLPTVTPEEASDAMRKYLALCEAVLLPADYQTFKEKGKQRSFKKKSAVKKLQTFFSLSVTIRDMQRDDLGDGHFGFRCIGVATAPNGRIIEASGGCSTLEERFDVPRKTERWDDNAGGYVPWTEPGKAYQERVKKANARSYHDVMSTAETRATNRAVMNCIGVGGGEVTADEIRRPKNDDRKRDDDPPPAPKAKTEQPSWPPVNPGPTDAMLERARSMGLISGSRREELLARAREYAISRGLEFRVGTMNVHMDEIDGERVANEPIAEQPAADWVADAEAAIEKVRAADAKAAKTIEKMRRKTHAIFSKLKYDDELRHDTYENVCGPGIRSWEAVVAAGKAAMLLDRLEQIGAPVA